MEKERWFVIELLLRSGETVVSSNACWLDHQPCPYGLPGGKFEDRPINFCFINENILGLGGCQKLKQTLSPQLTKVASGFIVSAINKNSA